MHDPSLSNRLKQLYVGPLEVLLPPLVTATPPVEAISIEILLAPDRLQHVLKNFGKQYSDQDVRGVASQWSKWYFNILLVPALLANLVLERELSLAPRQLHMVLNKQSRAEQLILRDEGKPLPSLDPFKRFATLINDALTPAVKTLAALSGASPRVFWSNAGNTFENIASQLRHHPGAGKEAGNPAQRFLERRVLPTGQRNPLYQPVRYLKQPNGSRKRIRRLCCIRYLISELDYCGNCPLL